jgi:hypothetical protein
LIVLASTSTVTLRIFERSMTMPSWIDAAPDVLWPPPARSESFSYA